MPCLSAFATPIFIEELNPPAQVEREMLRYVEKFFNSTKEKAKTGANITGDVNNEFLLHKQPEFYWLNEQIKYACEHYMCEIGVDLEKVSVYAQKAWPVICADEGYIPSHAHKNSVISCVYYLNEPLNNSGCLRLESDNCLNLLPIVFEDTDLAYKEVCLPPVKNRLILFPSALEHSVTTYYGGRPRFSVSYDLIVVSKEAPSSGDIEHWVMDPMYWEKL